MKNFLRCLRMAGAYRGRLVLSLLCALLAAVLWGLMFTCIDPVLWILKNGSKPNNNLQARQEQRIADAQKIIEDVEPKIAPLVEEEKVLDAAEPSPFREKRRRAVATQLDKLTRKLESARSELRWLHFSKKYIDEFMPSDAFTTIVWLFVFVIAAVALRGVFEFSQESLVGSVVNRSLYDLRNRFFRNVIHLDVNQFGEQGSGEMMARFTNDTELVGQGLKTLFGRVVSEPLKAISCVAFACWVSWQLTLMFLILVPVAFFILTKVGRMMKRATRRLLERMSSIYKILHMSGAASAPSPATTAARR
jgi:subfamily B ATP-binding cassette protein MsbA